MPDNGIRPDVIAKELTMALLKRDNDRFMAAGKKLPGQGVDHQGCPPTTGSAVSE